MEMKRHLVAEAKRSLTIVVCLAIGLGTAILNETPARAQNQNSRPLQSSDLAKENSSRVAASAGEIKPVLLKDSGLLVELKRWVAKDATDHGQIITETDLSDDSIFDRLENDIQFRAVATLLLQKYGYLVPQVNPGSALAREQLLLTHTRGSGSTVTRTHTGYAGNAEGPFLRSGCRIGLHPATVEQFTRARD
jgi:hypothetical protein